MAYEATVTSLMSKVEKISQSLGVFCGKVDVTTYDSTLVEITGITKYFIDASHTGEPAKYPHGVLAVVPNGLSDNGHLFEWNATSGAFNVYKPTTLRMDNTIGASSDEMHVDVAGGTASEIHTTSATGNIYAVATEAADNCDAGEVTFTAIGFVR